MPLVRKRLQIQLVGRPGVDRSIVFAVGELTEGERKRLRGTVFPAASEIDALRVFTALLRMAKEAADLGRIDQFLADLDRPTGPRLDHGKTFSQFSEEWLKTCVKGSDLRERSIKSDEAILTQHLVPVFGRLHLRAIGPRDVDQYKKRKREQTHQYERTYSAKTINNHLSVLHRIFEKALEWELIERNPVLKTAWMNRETTAEDGRPWWTVQEETKAVQHLMTHWRVKKPHWYFALLTQIVLGIRFAELRALHKEDLDLTLSGIWVRRSQAAKIVATPKNKKARFHHLPPALTEELRRWMLTTPGQLLFPAPRGGIITNDPLNDAYRRLCREAGVRAITSHGARHTKGSTLSAMGASQKIIGTSLGHASLESTSRYVHSQPNPDDAFVDARWESWASGERKP